MEGVQARLGEASCGVAAADLTSPPTRPLQPLVPVLAALEKECGPGKALAGQNKPPGWASDPGNQRSLAGLG